MLTIAGGILLAVAALFAIGFVFTLIHELFPKFWAYVGGCLALVFFLALIAGVGVLLWWWLGPSLWKYVLTIGCWTFGTVAFLMGVGLYQEGQKALAGACFIVALLLCLAPVAYYLWHIRWLAQGLVTTEGAHAIPCA